MEMSFLRRLLRTSFREMVNCSVIWEKVKGRNTGLHHQTETVKVGFGYLTRMPPGCFLGKTQVPCLILLHKLFPVLTQHQTLVIVKFYL